MEPRAAPSREEPATAPAGPFTYGPGSKPLPGFTIRRGIGHGGFGEVYAAVSDGGKEVALKLIRRNLEVELRGVRHCLNLKHPHLVMLLDIRQDGRGDHWVVMEHVRGETLDRVIARYPQGMPPELVLAWFHPLAQAVAYLHRQGIVHRDLKPGNIFNDQGVVKVGDYGLSKYLSPNRRSGQTENIGTVYYMAPEIASGRYGQGIDIYALGVLLYEMLTGHAPFEGESVGEILMKHLTAQPRLEDVPEPFRQVVARALAKDPQDRFATVEEMLAQLPPPPPGSVPMTTPAVPKAESVELVDSAGPADPLAATQPVAQGAEAPCSAPAGQAKAETASGEPLMNWLRRMHIRVRGWLKTSSLPPWAKVLVLVGLVALLLLTSGVWLQALIALAVLYVVYYVAWLLVQEPGTGACEVPARPHSSATEAPPRSEPPPVEPPPVRVSPPAGQPPAGEPPAPPVTPGWVPPWRNSLERWAYYLGAFVMAGVVAPVVASLLSPLFFAAAWNQCLWLALSATAASWAVLLLGFAWERVAAESFSRRFTLVGVGMLLGALSWHLQNSLAVHLAPVAGSLEPLWNGQLTTPIGDPTLRAYMLYFGLLFGVLRWWKLTELFRWARVSLWSVAVCGLGAWLLGLWIPFPSPWGVFFAITVAVTVQLAAPWVPPQRRPARGAASLAPPAYS